VVSFLDGVRNANKAINCFLLGAGGNILGAVASLPGGSPEFIENTTKALRRLSGCDPADDPVLPPSTPIAGQCPGVLYSFTAQGLDRGNVVVTQNPSCASGRRGPIGIRSESTSGGAGIAWFSTWFTAAGLPSEASIISGNAANITAQLINIVRCDGLPDDCGSVPPVFPPPTPIDIDIDVTYNIDDGTEVTVNIPFIYAPITTDINGYFRIPFTFEFGDVDFSGDISFNPDINVNINPPTGPRGIDSPLTDLPGPDDEIPVEPSTFAERVVGVVVQSQLVGEQQLTTIATTDIPQILAPRCGSVKFGYSIGDRSFWSPDIDIKDLNCFIPCPFSQGADTVAASPAPGVVLNYVPIFGAPLATVADLGQTVE